MIVHLHNAAGALCGSAGGEGVYQEHSSQVNCQQCLERMSAAAALPNATGAAEGLGKPTDPETLEAVRGPTSDDTGEHQ